MRLDGPRKRMLKRFGIGASVWSVLFIVLTFVLEEILVSLVLLILALGFVVFIFMFGGQVNHDDTGALRNPQF